ncbi:tRNA/rRNA methyltransferase [Perkinsela sp. CCAP 1560/4]|nr:tRNA/rRNA methyltransferase [Perkinsela sp. CCAP 1560/4]|eukprot:KNH09519.1 tRNA/rRNA methyltransferase [Perkinsela sp. CCAP 1560/4]
MLGGFLLQKFIPSLTIVNRSQRNESLDSTVLHGEFAVFSAIEAKKRQIFCLYYSPKGVSASVALRLHNTKQAHPSLKVLPLPKDSMNRFLGTKKHQGIAVRCSKRKPDFIYSKGDPILTEFDSSVPAAGEELSLTKRKYQPSEISSYVSPIDVSVLVLDDYTDHVLGAIIRVCVFYQVRCILLVHNKKLSGPETSRSACGSLDYANFIDCENQCCVSIIKDFASQGHDIAFVHGSQLECNFPQTRIVRKVLLVAGKLCPSNRQLLENARIPIPQQFQSKKVLKRGDSLAWDILSEEVPARLSEAAELALRLNFLHGQFV